MSEKKALIIGAGPAGLTAAYELINKTEIKPVVFEKEEIPGGISRTFNYKGNRMDIGGHRFFSKSQRVMDWWMNILPLQGEGAEDDRILGRKIPLSQLESAPDPEKEDRVMLIRQRLSRIYFLRKFFNYPISLDTGTLKNLGPARLARIGASFLHTRLFPVKKEKSLEDFFINRFGRELYETFFRDYTEKVWGVHCREISPEWGAQRIKGLSLTGALMDAARSIFRKNGSLKEVETSLIRQFYYPKLGPGQMWEETCRKIREKGGEIYFSSNIRKITPQDNGGFSVTFLNQGKESTFSGDFLFSSMAVKDLIRALEKDIPGDIRETADGLVYRDFITVGLLLKKLKISNDTNIKTINNIIPDNWIYVQEKDVRLGRIQIFNNWSPYMVKERSTLWLGLEYFCTMGDEMWNMTEEEMREMASRELEQIGIIDRSDVIDSTVLKVEKAYPAYFGTYDRFEAIRRFTDQIGNLFLIGRNGMHRYNNQDHSMLTAMVAVENIARGLKSKENIWKVNAEQEFHE